MSHPDAAICRHPYATSDGHCAHCDTDVSATINAALTTIDHQQRIALALQDALDNRDIITIRDPINRTHVHPGWTGPIAWDLAAVALEALKTDPPKRQ